MIAGIAVKAFLGQHWLAVGALSALVIGVWSWDSSRRASWMERGAAQATKRIEAANDDAANKGAAAARKSGAVGVRGQRDPSYRDQ